MEGTHKRVRPSFVIWLFRTRWFSMCAFWEWEGRRGVHLARPSCPSPSSVARRGGSLGKTFFPFSCCCGTGAVGGGTKRSTSKSNDNISFFFTYATPTFLGVPNAKRAEKIRSGYLTPSRVPRRGRKCYVTPAFSGVPNAKRGEKIRSGYLTPAFSGARRGRKCYATPAISGLPNAKRGDTIRSGPQVGTSRTGMHFQYNW